MLRRLLVLPVLGAGLALASPAVSGPVSQLSSAWYTLAFGHADTEKGVGGLTTGLVQSSLGPNGMPVRSPASLGFPATSSNYIVDVNGDDELLWWTPGTRAGIGAVTTDPFYGSVVNLPFNQPADLFPGGLSTNGNPNGFTTAHFFGTFLAPSIGTITLTVGADDDAWVFINGRLVIDLGGVKGLTPVPVTITGIREGLNRIDLFFADRQTVQSGLVFSADVAFSAIPAPTALAVFGAALLGFRLLRRRP